MYKREKISNNIKITNVCRQQDSFVIGRYLLKSYEKNCWVSVIACNAISCLHFTGFRIIIINDLGSNVYTNKK